MPNLEYFVNILWIIYFALSMILMMTWLYVLITPKTPELKYRYS